MIGDSEDGDAYNMPEKQQGLEKTNDESTATLLSNPITSTLSCSRQWSALRNPRIVRVSKVSGGKDRHSKVCTIRGLRDRRIRLSVPTAVQLYDLQDKLGLGQPSKVIDWLLDASKDDIDKLPPLESLQGFSDHQYFNAQPMLLPSFLARGSGYLKEEMLGDGTFLDRRHESFMSVDHHEEGESSSPCDKVGCGSGKGKCAERNEGRNYGTAAAADSSHQALVSATNFFPIVGYSLSSVPTVNPSLSYDYRTQWETLRSHPMQVDSPHASSSSTSGLSPNQQLYFCSPASATPLFPSYPQHMGHHLRTSCSLMPAGFHLSGSATNLSKRTASTKFFHREDRDDDDDGD